MWESLFCTKLYFLGHFSSLWFDNAVVTIFGYSIISDDKPNWILFISSWWSWEIRSSNHEAALFVCWHIGSLAIGIFRWSTSRQSCAALPHFVDFRRSACVPRLRLCRTSLICTTKLPQNSLKFKPKSAWQSLNFTTFFELFATKPEIDQDSKKNHNFLALWDSNLSLVQFKIVLSGRILRDGERSPYVRLTLWDILSVFFVVLVGVSSVLI